MTPAEGDGLVSLARFTLREVLAGRRVPVVKVKRERLRAEGGGAFVTLTTRAGDLRGCIGRFAAPQPLFLTVQAMAIGAATKDRRFRPVTAKELPELRIKVSVLSPLRRVKDPLSEVKLGTHGIYIIRGERRGCYLPEVATQTGWSLEQFLSHCAANKAGLPPGAWRDPATEVHVFTTQLFEEKRPWQTK